MGANNDWVDRTKGSKLGASLAGHIEDQRWREITEVLPVKVHSDISKTKAWRWWQGWQSRIDLVLFLLFLFLSIRPGHEVGHRKEQEGIKWYLHARCSLYVRVWLRTERSGVTGYTGKKGRREAIQRIPPWDDESLARLGRFEPPFFFFFSSAAFFTCSVET